MAHQIGQHDKQQGTEMAWHGLTEVREEITLQDNFLRTWEIEPQALYYKDGTMAIAQVDADESAPAEEQPAPVQAPAPVKGKKGKGKQAPAPVDPIVEASTAIRGKVYPWSILSCTDDPSIRIGAPFNPATFRPLKNAEFLDLIEASVKDVSGVKVSSVMSCCDRGLVSVSLSLAGLEKFKVGNVREFESYLNFIKGHDKKNSIVANTSNVCGVCANTVTMNLAHQGEMVDCRVKQTKNVMAEIANIPEIIRAAIDTQAFFAQAFASFDGIAIRHSEAKALFTGALLSKDFSPEDVLKDGFEIPTRSNRKGQTIQDISTRALNTVDRLLEIFHDDSKGNEGGTMADVFSAITDFYTHESAGGDDKWKQFVSSEFGSARGAKSEFFQLLTSPEQLALVRQAGEKLVKLID